MTDKELAAIQTLLEDTERARERLTELGGPEWDARRPRAPMLKAALALFAEVVRLRAENAAMREIVQAIANGATLYDEPVLPIYGSNMDMEAEPIGKRWICADCKRWVSSTESDRQFGLAQASEDIRHMHVCIVTTSRAVLAAEETPQ